MIGGEDERAPDDVVGVGIRDSGRQRDGGGARACDRSATSERHGVTVARARGWLALGLGALCLASAVGCQVDIDKVDRAFYDGDHRKLHCAVDIDDDEGISRASIDSGLDRAADRNEVVELFAHHPGRTIDPDTLAYVMAGAQSRGLPFVTYAELAHGTAPAAGLALSLDDNSVGAWMATRPLFQRYGARLTFFISRYSMLTDEEHAGIAQLADDGHDIEAHTVHHLNAPEYVENFGLDAYVDNELQPSIDVLRAQGYEVPVFAYPFGARTEELDKAILERVTILRSIASTHEDDPSSLCPP